MKRWSHAHDRIGLGGFFLDSSFNLSSDKFHYVANAAPTQGSGATSDQAHLLGNMRPAAEPPAEILSQYRAHLDLMTEMQRAGYDYCNEDLGVFGIHRHGPGLEKRLDSLPMWTECIATFDAKAVRQAGREPDDVFFRGLAYRMMWCVCWNVPSRELTFMYYGSRDAEDRPSAWHLALLAAFNEVGGLMRGREILPGEKGVLYRADGKMVLWAFAALELPLGAPRDVKDVLAGTTVRTSALDARARGVYLIS
jgi:hypothetical protein